MRFTHLKEPRRLSEPISTDINQSLSHVSVRDYRLYETKSLFMSTRAVQQGLTPLEKVTLCSSNYLPFYNHLLSPTVAQRVGTLGLYTEVP